MDRRVYVSGRCRSNGARPSSSRTRPKPSSRWSISIQIGLWNVSRLPILFFPDSLRAGLMLRRNKFNTICVFLSQNSGSLGYNADDFNTVEWENELNRGRLLLCSSLEKGLSSKVKSVSSTFFFFILESLAVCSAGGFHGDERALPWLVILHWRLQES